MCLYYSCFLYHSCYGFCSRGRWLLQGPCSRITSCCWCQPPGKVQVRASQPDTASVLRSLSLLTAVRAESRVLSVLFPSPVSFIYILLVESLLEQKNIQKESSWQIKFMKISMACQCWWSFSTWFTAHRRLLTVPLAPKGMQPLAFPNLFHTPVTAAEDTNWVS